MKVIANATPLIALAIIARLDLLRQMFDARWQEWLEEELAAYD